MTRVCLNMIVKNEAHVIERCLASVKPFVDRWVIVDTGSTDGTQELIRHAMAGVPGELHERPWRNFGHNRTEALELARTHGDYLFTIDADEVLRLPDGYVRPSLHAEAYTLAVEFSGIRYGRQCLVASRLPWRWIGVLHEYLECGHPVERPWLEGPTVVVHTDGARSQQGEVTKYAADARLLEAALRDEPDNSRYVFYLAQSYRDSAQPAAALAQYDRRAAMGGWDEECWYAQFAAALLAEKLGRDPAEVMQRYLQAFESRPSRGGETLGELARWCRDQQRFATARVFAERAMAIPMPTDLLFVDPGWYRWRCADEYAIACYWSGDYAECRHVCEELLAGDALPAAQRERVQANLVFARGKLG